MNKTLRDIIKDITKNHILEREGIVVGQCLRDDGRVRDTVPEMENEKGVFELSMDDTSGGSIAVGMALAGRRPIYISRFQGFQWYNAPEIINYAAKAKEIWGYGCPVFVRSIALEGGIGPVAGNSHHGIYFRMPGIPIAAPMTPKEYESVWEHFMAHDDPLYVSEHRRGWNIDYEMEDIIYENSDITLLPISSTRLNALEAITSLENTGISCNIVHPLWLKPFELNGRIKINNLIQSIKNSKYGGLVIDGDHINGVAKNLAYDLMHLTKKPVHALALEERTAGFAPQYDNLPPTKERICEEVLNIAQNLNK